MRFTGKQPPQETNPMRPTRRFVSLALPLLAIAACSPIQPMEQPVATSALVRSDGISAGTVRLFPQTTAVLVRIDASGLPPGQHGVHVHTVGRCDPPGFESAGAHWNPTGRRHGHRNPQGHHLGDLGNVGVGADGRLVTGLLVSDASLAALHDADGSALVIHARADDEVTDPSGNSGGRIACAVL
jgi:superoxide dismutase, Cu-Zn family